MELMIVLVLGTVFLILCALYALGIVDPYPRQYRHPEDTAEYWDTMWDDKLPEGEDDDYFLS